MLSKSQIMQIGAVTKNPALVARMMKDYKARQPRSRKPPDKVFASSLKSMRYICREVSEGWEVTWRFGISRVKWATYYYDWDGEPHREDGPAKIFPYAKVWCRHGVAHREDGPAIVMHAEWKYKIGVYLRSGTPRLEDAIFLGGGESAWVRGGKLHRMDGPAISGNNREGWWFDGQLHRMDGPAYKDEYVEKWYRHGKLHRLWEPAIIYKSGGTEWWCYGLQHRDDGPAVDTESAGTKYYVWGNEMTEEEFEEYRKHKVEERNKLAPPGGPQGAQGPTGVG